MRTLIASIILLAAALPAVADLGAYEIERFAVDLEVRPDASVVVTETIEVRFSEPRHGIYRVIPVQYTDNYGYEYGLGFKLLDVRDERGVPHRTKVTRRGHRARIRIGSPDTEVSGRVVYVIRYEARDAARHFTERDELYWNVTGNEWRAPIHTAVAMIRLPGEVADADVQLAGYVGPYGSQEKTVAIERAGPGAFRFAAGRRLQSMEGLTVAIAWPHGMVKFPGAVARAWRFTAANWIVLIPVASFLFLYRRWRTGGRDEGESRSVVVRYEPPEGLRPAELGTIVDESVDLRDITSTLVDLAVRGYLRIEVTRDDQFFGMFTTEEVVFHRLVDEGDSALPWWERLVLDGIFSGGRRVASSDLKNKFYREIPKIKQALYERLTSSGYFDGNPQQVRRRWSLLGAATGVVFGGLGVLVAKLNGAVMPQGLILPIASGAITLVLFLVFARAMPRRTRKGVEARGWALGFEEFIDRVESDRLEENRRRNVFESMLPYAMALGVAESWARQFEGIYTAGSTPGWYVGAWDSSAGFSTHAFERSLGSSITRAASAMTEAPRSSGSSGSGGGGSSGGGGGGGGGSW